MQRKEAYFNLPSVFRQIKLNNIIKIKKHLFCKKEQAGIERGGIL